MKAASFSPVHSFTLHCACELVSVGKACMEARSFMAKLCLHTDELDSWQLAMAEAANNAVENATEAGRQLPIRIDVSVTENQIEVRVVDHTPGFDYPSKVDLPSPESEGGRGLFLIQSLTDDVRYLRGRDENWLVMRKKKASSSFVLDVNAEVEQLRKQVSELDMTLNGMTEELASSYEILSAIFRLTSELQQDMKPDEFVRKWLGELLTTAHADWYVFRMADFSGKTLNLIASSQEAFSSESITLNVSHSNEDFVETMAALNQKDVWFDIANPPGAKDPIACLGPHFSGFAHPIVINDKLIGILTVGRSKTDAQFEAGQVSVVQTFADFLGIQLRNMQFQEEQVRARPATRELVIAANIQRSLLPKTLPEPKGFGIADYYASARLVGGDFYDVFATYDGHLIMVIADVMGKGLSAAMFATVFRSLVRARPDLAVTPAVFLSWLNRNLADDFDRVDMFLTAQLVCISTLTRELRFAGAGHPPLLVADRFGSVIRIESSGPPLGIMSDIDFREETLIMPPGCRLLLYTDGLNEARNRSGDQLGIDGIAEWLGKSACAGETAAHAKLSLVSLLRQFESGTVQGDDQAFLIMAEENQ